MNNSDNFNYDGNNSAALKNISSQDFLNFGMQDIAYVREVREDGKIGYAIHAANGMPLSVMDDMQDVLKLIFQNDLEAVTVQ